MQVLISSSRAACALSTHSGSASSGRAIEISCTWVAARICSAACGMVIRLEGTKGVVGHRGDDGGYPRLVPAEAGVHHRRAGGLDFGCQRKDVVPALTALDE